MAAADPRQQSKLDYFKLMVQHNASDLFFTTGAPPTLKINKDFRAIARQVLEPGRVKELAYSLMNEEQKAVFEAEKEMNLGVSREGIGRFRVNVYVQRGEVSMVIRYIKSSVPGFEELGLPPVLKDLALRDRGLTIVVGSTGSGKSTTLAAVIDYRARTKPGHILTIEDPIEFVFQHHKSIVSQREVGIDTLSYENALREAMREAPNVVMIGEIRDRRTMEAGLSYASTGHLVLSTLHAVNTNQAFERIVNFFPTEANRQLLMDLSLNIQGILAQRLVRAIDGGLAPAVEVLINTPYIGDQIRNGEFNALKDTIARGEAAGMQTFDQALFDLFRHGRITKEDALTNADSRSNLEWRMNFGDDKPSFGGDKETSENATEILERPSGLGQILR